MASSVIHMCVAKEINKKLKMDHNMILLGSIAPDISKHLGETKTRSHFFNDDKTINIDKFLDKYKNKLFIEPFMMGYYIHLYTDLLWEKYFIDEIVEKGSIKLLNGDIIDNTPDLYKKLIYNDYTNLNLKLIDEYNIDVSFFYNNIKLPNIYMEEIPIDKLDLIVEKSRLIIENTKENKAYTFNLDHIKAFIEICSNLIYLKILEINS